MAVVAGRAEILVAGNILVIRIGILTAMGVAENTFEYLEIIGIDMTIGACGPSTIVMTRIDWEIERVMVPG